MATFRPSARSKLAVCWAATVMPSELLDALGEALAAVARGGGAWHALQHDDLALLADRGGERLSGLGAAGDVVGGDEAGQLTGGGVAVPRR